VLRGFSEVDARFLLSQLPESGLTKEQVEARSSESAKPVEMTMV
jgi:hypothetical protein